MKNTDSHEIATGLRQEYMPAPLGYTIYMGKIPPEEKITIENIKWYFLTISSSFTKKKKHLENAWVFTNLKLTYIAFF